MGVHEFMAKTVYYARLSKNDVTPIVQYVPMSGFGDMRNFAQTRNLKINIASDRETMRVQYLGDFDPITASKNLGDLNTNDLNAVSLEQFKKCGNQAAYLNFFLETLLKEDMNPDSRKVLSGLLPKKRTKLGKFRETVKNNFGATITTFIFSFLVNHSANFGTSEVTRLLVWLSIPVCMLVYFVCTGFLVRGLILANVGSIVSLLMQFHSGEPLPGYFVHTVDIVVAVLACFLHKCEKKQLIQVLDKAFVLLNFTHEVQTCRMTNNVPVAPRFTFAETATFPHVTLHYFPYNEGCFATVKGVNYKIITPVMDTPTDFITCDSVKYLSKLNEESEGGQPIIDVYGENIFNKSCSRVKKEYMEIAREFITEVRENGLGSALKPFFSNYML